MLSTPPEPRVVASAVRPPFHSRNALVDTVEPYTTDTNSARRRNAVSPIDHTLVYTGDITQTVFDTAFVEMG